MMINISSAAGPRYADGDACQSMAGAGDIRQQRFLPARATRGIIDTALDLLPPSRYATTTLADDGFQDCAWR